MLGSRDTPVLWLGHDFKNPIEVWKRLEHCPGVMVNAYQLLRMRRWRHLAGERGIRATLGFDGPVFFDSGGFQFQQRADCSISPADLLALYRRLEPDVGAVLDLPLRPLDSRHVNGRRWRTTLEHTEAMFEQRGDLNLAPVLHALHPAAVPRRCDQLRAIAENPPVVCIGSLVPLLKQSHIGERFRRGRSRLSPTVRRWRVLAQLVLAVRRRFPDATLHAFGVGSLSTMFLLYLLGVDSVDSVSWRLKAAFGAIQLPGLADRFPGRDPRRRHARRRLSESCLDLLARCDCPVCRGRALPERVDALSASAYRDRAAHNAHVFLSEIARLRRAMDAGTHVELVRRRLRGSPRYRPILEDAVLPALERHPLPARGRTTRTEATTCSSHRSSGP